MSSSTLASVFATQTASQRRRGACAHAASPAPRPSSSDSVHWAFSAEDWNRFAQEQLSLELEDARRLCVLPVLGGLILSIFGAFLGDVLVLVGLPAGVLLAAARYVGQRRFMQKLYPQLQKAAHIYLSRQEITLPGQTIRWDTPEQELEAVRWDHRGILTFLFRGSQNASLQELVIPVPAGREADTQWLVQQLALQPATSEDGLWSPPL